jgi:hypothetical protein
MATFSFGSGVLIGVRTDVTPTVPVNFGILQDVEISMKSDLKELYGQFEDPIAVGRGKRKITVKAQVARISGLAFGHLFFGVAPVDGQVATQFEEAGMVPAISPYTITVANAATFVQDLGVVRVSTGLPLKKVTTVVGAGEYSVVTAFGEYTFSSGNVGADVKITYAYSIPASGQKIIVPNSLMGAAPTFSAHFYTNFQGKPISMKLHRLVAGSLSFKTKLDDFTMPEFEASAFADSAGNVLTWSFAEAG